MVRQKIQLPITTDVHSGAQRFYYIPYPYLGNKRYQKSLKNLGSKFNWEMSRIISLIRPVLRHVLLAPMLRHTPPCVESAMESTSRTQLKKIVCRTLLILVLGLFVFMFTLHVWIGVLFQTGVNRGDISVLTGEIEAKCSTRNQTRKPEFSRLIHQIWNTKDIPSQFIEARESCKRLNPDYKYKLWTPSARRNLIADHYVWFLDMYDSYDQEIMRINAARYFIIYHYGGMYLDIDMACKVPFDEMLRNAKAEAPNTGVLLGATVPSGCGTAWIFAGKNHPFMELVTRRLLTERKWYVLPYWTNTISTGVLYMWRTYLNYPCQEQVFMVKPDIQNDVYFNHLHFSSWHRWDAPFFMFWDFIIKHFSPQGLFILTVIPICLCILYNKVSIGKLRANVRKRKGLTS